MKIKKEEKQDIEFKQSWRDEYLKWICAFSNTNGGTLYIGVQDDGEVCGIEDAHKLSEDIPNKILHTMGLICGVDLLTDKDKKYFQITVEKSLFPVSYHGKYYKRSGSTTQEVTGFELDKMILFAIKIKKFFLVFTLQNAKNAPYPMLKQRNLFHSQ